MNAVRQVPIQQMAVKIKSLLLRAWRERWTDVKWSVCIKQVLPPNTSGDDCNLSELLLQQALIGSSPNYLVLSYLKHALSSQIITYTCTLHTMMSTAELGKPYCLKGCLEVMEGFIPNICSLASVEDSIYLAQTLLLLSQWLYQMLEESLHKAVDSKLPAEYATVAEKLLEVQSKLSGTRDTQAMLFIALKENPDIGNNISQLEGTLQSMLGLVPTNLQSKMADIMVTYESLRNWHIQSEPLMDLSQHPLNYSINTLITVEAMMNPCKDIQHFAEQLIIVQQLQNLTLPELYCEILRASFMGQIDAGQSADEMKWAAFTYLKIPLLLSRFVTMKNLPGNEGTGGLKQLEQGLDLFLNYTPLLDLADSKQKASSLPLSALLNLDGTSPLPSESCDCLQFFLGELCNKYSLITEAQYMQFLARRNAESEKPKLNEQVTNQPSPNLILRAEPTVTSVLKTLDMDYSKNQEALLKVLCHMLSGKSFELILSTAAATGKLQTFATKLVKFNEFAKQASIENPKGAQVRALLFDVTFLMLCHIVQLYGTDIIASHKESQKAFFTQWAIWCLPEDSCYKSIETFPQPDNSKRDALLEQLKPGGELRNMQTCWSDVCHNAPFAVQEVLNAWEHGSLNHDGVKAILDNMKNKICCLPVVTCAFLCSYANVVSDEARKTPVSMIHQLGSAATPDAANQFYVERSHLMSQLIRKMLQGILPATKRTSRDDIISSTLPCLTLLQETYKDIFVKGYADIKCINRLDGLRRVTGTQWFCDNLVKELLSHTRDEEYSKSLGLVFAIFNIDLEALTTTLLHRTVPGFLQGSVNKLSMLTDPKGRTLAKLCVMCMIVLQKMKSLTSDSMPIQTGMKRPRADIELENGEESEDQRPSKQMRLSDKGDTALPEAFPLDFPLTKEKKKTESTSPENKALANLLHLCCTLLASNKISQRTSFIVALVEEFIKTGGSNAQTMIQHMPKDMVSFLMKTLPGRFTTEFIMSMCDTSSPAGRKRAAKALCQNAKLKNMRQI